MANGLNDAGIVWSIAQGGGDLYVAGDFSSAGAGSDLDTNVQRVAKLDLAANRWLPVGNGISNGRVCAMDSIGGVLYIGGSFTTAGGNTNVNYIARLEGGVWTNVGAGISDAQGFYGVQALAACGTNLFVGGSFLTAGGDTNAHGLAIWNTKEWRTFAGGVGNLDDDYPEVWTLAPHGNHLFVGGRFTSVLSGTNVIGARNIVMTTWSEADQCWTWTDLDWGAGGRWGGFDEVRACAIADSGTGTNYDLYIAGTFQDVGSFQDHSPSIARWRIGQPKPPGLPAVTITSPANYAVFTNNPANPTPITVTATVSSYTNVQSVEFFEDGGSLGSDWHDTDTPYTNVWSVPSTGAHLLQAVATDVTGLKGQSKAVLISVKDPTNSIIASNDVYSIPESSPTVVLRVLTNDTSSSGSLRISQVSQLHQDLGRAQVGHNGAYLSYTPFPHVHGTDLFAYAVTNASGAVDSAWVTVNIRAKPTVQIDAPYDGRQFGSNAVVTISGHALDYDGQVTNVVVFRDGTNVVGQTTNPSFTLIWSNTAAGFYTFIAVATDNDGLTNASSPVTVAVTNAAAATNVLTASIDNLPVTATSLGTANYTVVNTGLFTLQGKARDSNANDPIAYQVLLVRPEDNPDPEAAVSPVSFANVTPPPLDVAGFHNGGDISNGLGTLDFAAIPNGTYDLLLVVHGGGRETNATARFSLDTQLKIGQFSFSEQDLVIPVNGIPLTVTRTYNSLNPRSADFGYSWSYSLVGMDVVLDDERQDVTVGGNDAPWADDEEDHNGLPRVVSIRTGGGWDVTLTLPDGRRTTFAFTPTFSPSECRAYANWIAPTDVHATLTPLGAGQNIINLLPTFPAYWQCGGDNSTFVNHDVAGWVLQTQDGTKYNITRGNANNVTYQDTPGHFISIQAYGSPTLTSIVQRTGDTITIGSDGIAHHAHNASDATRSVFFDRDNQRRIKAIRDPNSGSNGLPVLKYVYHTENGNLLQVLKLTDRATKTYLTTKYHYDNPRFPHYITSIENPLGIPVARNEYDDSGRLTAVVDADGNRTEFHHSTTNSTEVVIDRRGYTNTFTYDPRGNVIATTNALGGITTMAYDYNNNKTHEVAFLNNAPYATNRYAYTGEGFVMYHTDPLQQTVNYLYNNYGQVTNSVDARGYGTTNYYDSGGNLTSTIDTLGNTTTNVYNDQGLLTWSRDAVGTITANAYDEAGNLTGTSVSETSKILCTNSFEYDANGNRTKEVVWRQVNIQWQGATNQYVFDGQNRVVQTIDPLGFTSTVVYNEIGKQAQTIDKLGQVTTYEYDWQGRLVRTTYPDTNTETSVYDSNGNRISSIDRAVRATAYNYDALGRQTNVVYPDMAQTFTFYDDLGRVSFSVDARGTTNAFGYDLAGRQVFATNALGVSGVQTVSSCGFDANGNQTSLTNALGFVTMNTFDALNRQINVSFPDGTCQTTAYDAVGRRIAQTDQATNTTWFASDGLGRLTSVTNAVGKVTSYAYDEAGNQTSQTDALGRQTRFEFDALGRRTKRVLPGAQSEGFAYDPVGNPLCHTNFNGAAITNVYDNLNRLLARVYPDGTSNSFTYTATGQRETMSDASGDYTFIYDLRDRLITNSTPAGVLAYGYDSNGNVTSIRSSTIKGTHVTYQYDALNRLTNVIDGGLSGTQNTRYTFDAVGNLRGYAYPNGVTNLYRYDALNRLTNLTWKLTTSTLADFSYRLGLTGNRTNTTASFGTCARLEGALVCPA